VGPQEAACTWAGVTGSRRVTVTRSARRVVRRGLKRRRRGPGVWARLGLGLLRPRAEVRRCNRNKTTTDAFIVKAMLPPELSYWVSHWARNPVGMPKPIREDEFGRLDIGDLDVWLWSRMVASDTHKDVFIMSLWSIFLTIGRWEELVDGANWALPVANHLRNNIIARGHGKTGPIRTTSTPASSQGGWVPTRALRPTGLETSLSPMPIVTNGTCTTVTRPKPHTIGSSPRGTGRPSWPLRRDPLPHLPWKSPALPHPHTQSGWQPDYLRHRYLVPPPLLTGPYGRGCGHHSGAIGTVTPHVHTHGRGRCPCHQHCW